MAGSAPTNNSAVDFEKQQAAEADAKEAARQQRLTQGQAAIDAIFNPQPEMATTSTPFDWSKLDPQTNQPMLQYESIPQANANANANQPSPYSSAELPVGYTLKKTAGADSGTSALGNATAALTGATTGNTNTTMGGSKYTSWSPQGKAAAASQGTDGWEVVGPDGKTYKQGDAFNVNTQTPTGKTTGGFGDDFYNSYKQKILDYYQPDETKQYNEAQRDLTYNLARAGTLQSSTAADKTGDLAYNDAIQKANIVSKANDQTGQLRDQIQSNKQSLINQLYTTEDPTLTANLAQSSARASQLKDPELTPMANLFTPAVVGATSAASGLGYGAPLYGGTAYGNAPSSPTPAAASQGSGKLSGGYN